MHVTWLDEAPTPVEEARKGDVVPVDTVPSLATFDMVFRLVVASAAPAPDAGAAPVPSPEETDE